MRKRVVIIVAVVALVTVGSSAAGQAGSRQGFVGKFTTERSDRPTGLRERIDYFNPNDRSAKPFAVEKIELSLAPGAEIDTSVPAQCKAPDPVLIARGASACPKRSRVGDGQLNLDTGFPGPFRIVRNDLTLLNNDDEVIFLLEDEDSGQRTVSRAEVNGRTFTSMVPPIPGGPPDGFTALKLVKLDIDSISTRRKGRVEGYLETPPSCPRRGAWTNTATFTYRDGAIQTERSSSPCRRSRGRGNPGGSPNVINGTDGNDVIRGTSGDDIINCGAGDDTVFAGAGNDIVNCGPGDDVIYGGSGDDILRGEEGDDRIFGESGDDRIDGGPGDDVLVGHSGNDRLVGGGGRDRFSSGT